MTFPPGLVARSLRRRTGDAVGLCDENVGKPGGLKSVGELFACERAGDAAGVCRRVARVASSMSGVGDESETANRPPGLSMRAASRKTLGLVAGEVDDAVGDDHVDAVSGEGDVLDVAAQSLDVGDPGLGLVARGVERTLPPRHPPEAAGCSPAVPVPGSAPARRRAIVARTASQSRSRKLCIGQYLGPHIEQNSAVLK